MCSFHTPAQTPNTNQDYSTQRNGFKRKLSQPQFDDQVHIVSVLPDWFADIPVYSSSEPLLLGISDALDDTTRALQQAVLRAKAMGVLFHGHQREEVFSSYQNEGYDNLRSIKSLAVFAVFKAEKNIASNYDIVYKVFLKSGEAIVLIKPQANGPSSKLSVHSEVMTNIDEYKGLYDLTRIMEWTVSEGETTLDDALVFQQNAVFSNENIADEAYTYSYYISNDGDSGLDTLKHLQPVSTKAGLWPAYYTAVMLNFLSFGVGEANIKALAEEIQGQMETYRNEIVMVEQRALPQRIQFCKNHLYVQIHRKSTSE